MRMSRVRRKLAEGKPVLVTKMNTFEPVIADMIGLLGFDCVWLCNEHSAVDWDRLGNLIRTCAMNDMDAMVRVSKGAYTDYIRPLELGAAGIMVPHCMSAQEARELGQSTRFHPLGRRALDSGNADGHYCMIPLEEYLRRANENTFVVAQIEDPEALAEIDGIVSAPGVDAVFVGPADLTHGLGVPGRFDDPRLHKAIADVAAACRRHGKHWGLPVSADTAPKYLEMGARFLASGADVLGLAAYLKDVRAKFQNIGFEFHGRL